MRNGHVSVEDVVAAYVERIRFDEALREARDVDDKLDKLTETDKQRLFEEKPFLGIPFTIKDCFSVKDLSWTAGLYYRRHEKGTFDSPVVEQMKSAGCILVGVTNVSELCMWMESNNTVYGRSHNPYHTGRTVGGSSGGEGAVIAAAGSAWGVGSDVGGSIRMPAFFNGIFGHKPSTGIVNNHGQLPQAYGIINEYLVTGPMCRYAEDLAPMLKILSGSKAELLNLDSDVDVSGLKVYYLEDDGGFPLITPVHSDLRRAQKSLLRMLKNRFNVEVRKAELPNMFHSLLIWTNSMAGEPSSKSFSAELVQLKGEVNPWFEMIRWCLGLSVHTLPALFLALAEKFVFKNSEMHRNFIKLGDTLRDELETLLGDDGVLIYPSHPTPAPYHNLPLLRPFNFAYTGIFNILGNPVTQVPLGLGSDGVPLGVQIVGARHQDRLCLAVARSVEQELGGWHPPSTLQR